jgi:lysine biosynthesis protein LysW
MITVYCIDCEQPIRLDSRPIVGELLLCSSCGTEFEVISVEPIELDWAYLEPMERDRGWKWWNEKSRRIRPSGA